MKIIRQAITRYTYKLQHYPDIWLIIEVTVLVNLWKIIFAIILTIYALAGMERFDIPITQSAFRDLFYKGSVFALVYGLFIAPFIETIFAQTLVIKVMAFFTKSSIFPIIISALIFSLVLHNEGDQIFALYMGIILATVYFLKSKTSSTPQAIKVTFAIHSLTNLLTILLVLWFRVLGF